MPLIFSPLTEDVLESPPKVLRPRCAFVMRQLGRPPYIDIAMHQLVINTLNAHGLQFVDASDSTGSKDFLERIVGLIRSTGFTVAIFSHETAASTMANIALELGMAAMCGKPLIIIKSPEAKPPSDLTRTDYINCDAGNAKDFETKCDQAIAMIDQLAEYEHTKLEVALEAREIDCAVAFERANKGFLLSGEARFIEACEQIQHRIRDAGQLTTIGDLERLREEIGTFIRQARKALAG